MRVTPSPSAPQDPAGAPARAPGASAGPPREPPPEALERLRRAAAVLTGEIDVAALPPSQQRALLDELVRGKVPLFAADSRNPAGPSRLRFAALATSELEERLAV